MVKKWLLAFAAAAFAAVTLFAVGCAPEDAFTPGDEVGEYYYEAEGGEYLLTLEEDGSASLSVGEDLSGTYTLAGDALTLNLGEQTIDAEYSETSISLTYGGEEMEFLKKVYFTVTFETNGGTAIESAQVLNGKTVAEPEEEPSRTNYTFSGWYSDSAASVPFDFEAPITADTTVYAGWEYVNTLTYDTESGVSGSVSVKEGDTYTLAVPEVAAEYDFLGWFTEDGVQLTGADGESLSAWDPELGNVTVYARSELGLTYEYSAETDSYTASGSDRTRAMTDIVIPAYYRDGKPVTAVYGFSGYTNLVSVSIPETVTDIGETTFLNCPLIKQYTVYDVEGVNDPAYRSEDGVIFSGDGTVLSFYPIAKEDTEYTIPQSVLRIGPSAFRDANVGSDYRPQYIGVLEKVVLPANLTEIGGYAFYQRGDLKTVEFSGESSVAWTIGDYAFYEAGLTQFPFSDDGLKAIGNYAFYGATMGYYSNMFFEEVILPEGLETIGEGAFFNLVQVDDSWNTMYWEVYIPSTVTSIGKEAFSWSSVNKVTFAEGCSLTEIPDSAFEYADFTSIEIPASVKTIGADAFYGTALEEVTIPEGVESIGGGVFRSASSLVKVSLPSTLTYFGDNVFTGCNSLDLAASDIKNSEALTYRDGVLYSGDMTRLLYYPRTLTNDTYVMPDTVTSFPESMFRDHEYLVNITLSSNLTSIPAYSFTNIQKGGDLVIPASVTSIGREAFNNAYFASIVFEEGCELTSVDTSAFTFVHTDRLVLPEYTAANVGGVFSNWGSDTTGLPAYISFGEGTETLTGSLSNISLQEVVLPTTLVSVDKALFNGCSALVTVTIGSQEAADILLDGGIPETVTTLKLREGITAAPEGFTAGEVQDGYVVYTRTPEA